jgi:hypothetical protein
VNDYLAKASAANPLKLVLDGTAAMKGVVISAQGNTWIEGLGWGTGIAIEAKSNQDGIRIGAYAGGYSEGQGPAVPARGASNIILSNFSIDANGQANSTGQGLGVTPPDSPVRGAPAHAILAVVLANATGILVDHVRFINPPRYCLTLVNVADVTVRDSSFTSSQNLQDGVHVDGPAEDIRVLNNVFATGDDGVALNAPEGYSGDITDVLVDGNTFLNAWSVVRVYTSIKTIAGDTHYARRLTFSRNRGTTRDTAFNLGIQGELFTGVVDQIKDVSIEDNDVSSPHGFAMLHTPFGSVRFVGNTYTPTTTAAMVHVFEGGGADVELTGNTILRNGDGNAAAPLFESLPGQPLGRLTLAGNRVTDEVGSKYEAIPYLMDIAGPLGALRIDSADMTGVTALVNPATGFKGVGQVSGPGVLATNARIPDAVMADGSVYVSATGVNAGKACVKLDGKVAPL